MEPSRNWVIVPACQTTEAGGIDSLESIPGKFKNTVSEIERQFVDESVGGGVREEPNHTTARRNGLLHIIQYSLNKIYCSALLIIDKRRIRVFG